MVTFWLNTVEIAKSYQKNLFANVYVGHCIYINSLISMMVWTASARYIFIFILIAI